MAVAAAVAANAGADDTAAMGVAAVSLDGRVLLFGLESRGYQNDKGAGVDLYFVTSIVVRHSKDIYYIIWEAIGGVD